MTYLEKLKLEHPDVDLNYYIENCCPSDFGWATRGEGYCGGNLLRANCRKCWNMEMPERNKED